MLLQGWSLRRVLGWSLLPAVVLSAATLRDPQLQQVVGLAWDTGAVTTGPVTVPIVLALGRGLAQSRADAAAASGAGFRLPASATATATASGFGIVALAGMYPVSCVLLLASYLQHFPPSSAVRTPHPPYPPTRTHAPPLPTHTHARTPPYPPTHLSHHCGAPAWRQLYTHLLPDRRPPHSRLRTSWKLGCAYVCRASGCEWGGGESLDRGAHAPEASSGCICTCTCTCTCTRATCTCCARVTGAPCRARLYLLWLYEYGYT
jgi:hypothetical protein